MKSEARVGVFVFFGLLFLFALSSQVAKFGSIGRDGYSIYSYLDTVSGLDKNAKVKVNGINGGYVEDMLIENKKVKLKLFIYQDISIPTDSTLKLSQDTMLGGKLVDVTMGRGDGNLKDGDLLTSGKEYAGFTEASDSINLAAIEFRKFMEEIRGVLDENSRDDLKNTFQNIAKISEELKNFIKQDKFDGTLQNFNDMALSLKSAGESFGGMSNKFSASADTINQKLPQIIEKIDSFVASFDGVGKNLDKELPVVLDKFSKLEDELRAVVEENRDSLKKTFDNAEGFFGKGEETFLKVDKYVESMTNTELEVALRSEYMADDAFSKSYFSLAYKPNPTRYYLFDVVSADDYSRLDALDNPVEPKKHEKGDILVSAQVGKRYENFLVRGGIIESTGGMGFDYFIHNDKFKASFEVFDFNAQNDVRGEHAHAKASLRYTVLKHLDLYVGYDNFLNDESANVFAGFGVRFIDNDLKNLLGSGSFTSFAK